MSEDNTKISIQYQQYEYSLRNSHIPGIICNITVKVVMFRGYVSDAFRCEHWPHGQLSLRHGVCSSYELRSFRTSSSTAVGQSCGIEMHPSHPFLMAKWRESFDIHWDPLNSFRKNAANSAQRSFTSFFVFLSLTPNAACLWATTRTLGDSETWAYMNHSTWRDKLDKPSKESRWIKSMQKRRVWKFEKKYCKY